MSERGSTGGGRKKVAAVVAAIVGGSMMLAGAWWYWGVAGRGAENDPLRPGARRLPAGQTMPNPLACCGYRMDVEGEVFLWQSPPTVGGAAGGETLPAPAVVTVPEEFRSEIFGNVFVAKAPLPPGRYRIEVMASENSWGGPGRRVFDVTAVTTRAAGAPPDAPEEVRTALGRGIDLFTISGPGRPATISGTVDHGGGVLKVVFTTQVDFAKVSAIRVTNAAGEKVAWLFARDMADFLRLPGDPPVVEGPVVWKNPDAPLDTRVADLLKRMTLREKAWQMSHTAPGIERLGLPPYNYWSEALHGVARHGVATVYPQAIGMAASFNPELLQTVADSIATEGRAKFHEKERQIARGASRETLEGGDGGRYQGLTFWSPNINIFRDPRWGRGHETYGEDPLLSGRMGVAFIKGLQGDDPKYFKTLACAKHFAVHSGPESLRHVFDARPPEQDFYDTYLPQFEAAVREGKVVSVMGAYNRVYGEPACASPLLLKDLLRKQWGFEGYVVSDCGAITDVWANHRVASNQAAAAAASVLAGCDLECGAEYGSLAAAVDLHLLGEGAMDVALGRVLKSRFQLGLFDPPERVPFARIGIEQNDTPAHDALALQMARESIVLLKNDGILPLDPARLRKVALVGPNADGLLPLLGNYNGTPSRAITVVEGLRAALPAGVELVHIKGCDNAVRQTDNPILPDIQLRPTADVSGPTGVKAEYFTKADFSGTPAFTRIEKGIDVRGLLEWLVPVPRAASPVAAIRYSGVFVAPVDGTYLLQLTSALPYRWTVENRVVVDLFAQNNAGFVNSVTLQLKAGQTVPLQLDTRTFRGMADAQLFWRGIDAQGREIDPTPAIVDRVKDADVILFASGLDGHMEAEEGDVRAPYDGFESGDRTAIEMPATQAGLIRALAASGRPVVLVNLSGGAIAMPWEAEHLPAIVQAWYPGQAGGRAVADVLLGAYNPAGRLPVTFYRSTADLPAFADYAMSPGRRTGMDAAGASWPENAGRTYRYFSRSPLWSFGHGLSFTRFDYGPLILEKPEIGPDEAATLSITVRNGGSRDGEEVVQIYARPPEQGAHLPRQTLVAFQRVAVKAGSEAQVRLTVPGSLLRAWNIEQKRYAITPGRYTIMAGASSSDIRNTQVLTIRP